jgi:hypothetical protein
LRSRRVRHHSQRGRRVDDRHHHPPVARGRGPRAADHYLHLHA